MEMAHKLKKPSKILPNEEIVCGSCGGVILAKNWNKHNEYHDEMDALLRERLSAQFEQ
jgi:hypothetical protein